MTRHIPGLHHEAQNGDSTLEGIFLVRVERAFYRWHPQKPFFTLRLAILEPKGHAGQTISGRLYCTPKALWKLSWFLRDFGYDTDLLGRDEVDEKALVGLRGSCGFPTLLSTAAVFSTSKDSLPLESGKNYLQLWRTQRTGRGRAMTYSYTQVSQYLRCPRSYRHRYLDGWKEKETRAAMLFGRCFEKALAAYFRKEDSAAVLFKEWGAYRETPLEYSNGDSWERMARQGVQLLERLAQDDRLRVRQPRCNLQVKLVRPLLNGNDFVAHIDAIGYLDGTHCLLEWKTTTSRYPAEPEGLLSLDPQLVCYSWVSDIADVALVVFIRKRVPEIQYLRTSITEEQRREFGQLVEATASQIEAGQFLPHTGIRFPQNGCVSCPYLGLCLGNQQLVEARLTRRPGASDLDWLDQLDD